LGLYEGLWFLSSKYVAALDAGAVPEPVFTPASGRSASCQAASAVKTFSAILPGPPLDTGIRPVILSPIISGS
jgi:hypothetical protein